ncbi:MAG: lytic murein transglycosylase [Solirubrobacterales bacterium]|nr:lytic murein transglycosylase [Solirubrobacterales bacterium]
MRGTKFTIVVTLAGLLAAASPALAATRIGARHHASLQTQITTTIVVSAAAPATRSNPAPAPAPGSEKCPPGVTQRSLCEVVPAGSALSSAGHKTPAPTPPPAPPRSVSAPAATPAISTPAMPSGALANLPPLISPLQRSALDLLLGVFPVPPFLLPIYHAAAADYGVPWQVLAAINEIETDYGRNLSTSSAGAVGWMQFLPSTWARFGVDADGDGVANPYDPVDAIFSAARYLRAAGAWHDLPSAIFAYNHAAWYVNSVELRAQLLGLLPGQLVDVLTGLMQARFPIGGHLGRYAKQSPAASRLAGQPAVVLSAPPGAPVIASADGRVISVGSDQRRGRYVTIEDSYGDRFTYGQLGRVEPLYPVVRPRVASALSVAAALAVGLVTKPRIPAATRLLSSAASGHSLPARGAARTAARPRATPFVPLAKERLFADPSRPASYAAGGIIQLRSELGAYLGLDGLSASGAQPDYYSETVHLRPGGFALAPLSPGSVVLAGTILGRVARPAHGPGRITLQIRPAGASAPVDPGPIVSSWEVLGKLSAGRPSAAGAAQAGAYGSPNPWVGQLLMAPRADLERSVLVDSRVTLDDCGRSAVKAGAVDRRVLAVIEYLAYAGLSPGVSGLPCPRGRAPGQARDTRFFINEIDRIPVAGRGRARGLVDVTVRQLLVLQGALRPSQIVSALSYPGNLETMAWPGRATQIEVDFDPVASGSLASLGSLPSLSGVLDTTQWRLLVRRLVRLGGAIPTRTVR